MKSIAVIGDALANGISPIEVHLHPWIVRIRAGVRRWLRGGTLCKVVADGDWSDPTIWKNGRIPTDNDDVLIPRDRKVTASEISLRAGTTMWGHGALTVYGTSSVGSLVVKG